MKRLTFLLLLLAAPAAAQDFPAPLSPYVSDFAGILDDPTEARITEALHVARDDPGTEIAVVTIRSRADHGDADRIESFATGLFNHWGIGDAASNDGILILVAVEDREMRLELGSGYPPVWDTVAENVIDNNFLPSFRDGDLPGGIQAGTRAAIERIARPFALNRAPDTGGSWFTWFLEGPLATILVVVAVVALIARRRIGNLLYRLRRCPTCGRRGLSRRRKTLSAASQAAPGEGRETVSCHSCDYVTHRSYSIAYQSRSSSSGGGFGGGSSSGGGASGRW